MDATPTPDPAFDSASVFIRPQEWTQTLASAYRITSRQAGRLLRAAADESALAGEVSDLLGIWERACRACDRYTARREVAAGILLGYYRWRTRPDGTEELVSTALAHATGVERISRDIDAAIDASFDAGAEIELELDPEPGAWVED